MSQTIRRQGTTARKAASRANSARKVEAARKHTGSALDAVMAYVPFSEQQLHRIFLVVILACAGALLWLVASLAGVPAMAEERVASLTAHAGFAVRRVEVHGVKHINELQIYERVLGAQNRQAMTRIDLDAIRADLMQLSWVEEARVSRQLPDALVIDITERKPHAVMRVRGSDGSDSFVLIDQTGHELEGISATRAKGRLVLAGEGAESKVADLATLLDAAPALRPQVAEAEWVGKRRWNLTFKTGQTLALPEGAETGAKALVKFAQLDGTNQLIGGQAMAFDMRNADRIYLRVKKDDGTSALTPVAGSGSAPVAPLAAVNGAEEKPKVSEKAKLVEKPQVAAKVKPEIKAKPETKAKPAEKPKAAVKPKSAEKPAAKAKPVTKAKAAEKSKATAKPAAKTAPAKAAPKPKTAAKTKPAEKPKAKAHG